MKVLDTCIWIELVLGTATGKRYEPLLLEPTGLIVPTLVHYELRRWALREYSAEYANNIQAGLQATTTAPLEQVIALHAADLATLHKLTTADAIIYATALRHKATLVTCDTHFQGLSSVDYISKISPKMPA